MNVATQLMFVSMLAEAFSSKHCCDLAQPQRAASIKSNRFLKMYLMWGTEIILLLYVKYLNVTATFQHKIFNKSTNMNVVDFLAVFAFTVLYKADWRGLDNYIFQ